MKQEALRHFDLPWLPITGLVLFVVCFTLYAWWTYRKENKGLYDAAALIPLEDFQPKNLDNKGRTL